jgi:hypothetical protein
MLGRTPAKPFSISAGPPLLERWISTLSEELGLKARGRTSRFHNWWPGAC